MWVIFAIDSENSVRTLSIPLFHLNNICLWKYTTLGVCWVGSDEVLYKSLIFALKPLKRNSSILKGKTAPFTGWHSLLWTKNWAVPTYHPGSQYTATRATWLFSVMLPTFEGLHSFYPVNWSLLVTELWFPEKVWKTKMTLQAQHHVFFAFFTLGSFLQFAAYRTEIKWQSHVCMWAKWLPCSPLKL